MKHINIFIEGKVQGVFFRKNTEQKANELGLFGFVQNNENGKVYIEIEGNDEALHQLITWCNDGPEKANVIGLQISQTDLVGFNAFEIR